MASSGDQFSASQPQRGAWLVYLNGLEVPCPSLSVSYGVKKIPEATFTFPAHRALQRLGNEDRLEVVVFFLDTMTNPEYPEFKLLFEGEMIGWSYSNTPSGRGITFNAVADISIMKQLHFFFMNTVDAVIGAKITKGADAESIATPGVFYPFSLFKKGLVYPGKDAPADVDRPFEILYNIVQGMTSSKVPAEQRAIPAMNFFARWARKRNFINRFAALPSFEDTADKNAGVFPVFKAVQADFALKTMQESLSTTVGDSGSLYDVLDSVLRVALYELAMIPTAPCFRVRLKDGTIIGPLVSTAPTTADQAALEPIRLVNYFVKPQMLFGIPPACNVIFPSMMASYRYQESYLTQPTRTYVNDSLITGALGTNSQFVSAALTVGYPPEVSAVLHQRGQIATAEAGSTQATIARDIRTNGKNVLVFPEEFYKGPVLSRNEIPSWFQLMQNKLDASKTETSSTPESEDQLLKFYKLTELYVQYEHFRQRFEKRGGAVDMRFNPFIIPGFSCAIFDQRETALDTQGYVMDVSQNLSVGSMRTAISYGFGRTFQEMFGLLLQDISKLGLMGASPADPIDQNRLISQDQAGAEEFYGALLFGRAVPEHKATAFDFTQLIGMADKNGEPVQIVMSGPTIKDRNLTFHPVPVVADATTSNATDNLAVEAAVNANAAAAAAQKASITTNLTADMKLTTLTDQTAPYTGDIVPLKSQNELFVNPDAAMQYVSRPICTLSEYIQFMHGSSEIGDLIEQGQVEGPSTDFGYAGKDGSVSAIYYKRIKKLRQGPGARPAPSIIGALVTPVTDETTNGATPYTGAPTGVDGNFPQTREDWDEVLERYRAEVLDSMAPLR